MTTKTTEPAVRSALDLPGAGPFQARHWLNYFEQNKNARSAIRLSREIVLDDAIKQPLIRSLQRFQIGETGDGKHLKKYAKALGDADYIQCMDLFVKEEQSHGQILAEVILALNGTLLTWHWTDHAFIFLRHLFRLKTELFIILIAEVIGKAFYRCVADKIQNQDLSNVFAIIVCDEIAHLRFHSEFLNQQLKTYPWALKCLVHYVWSMIFYTACFVFVLDHKGALEALGMPTARFISACSKEFQRAGVCALGMEY